VKQKPVFYI